MIELTEQKSKGLNSRKDAPTRFVNLQTKETFVLLRTDEYVRLTEHDFDDDSWTRDELQAIEWQAGEEVDWEAYDDAVEKP